jgi:hypothetical protein
MTVLVAAASTHGAMRGIAEAIAQERRPQEAVSGSAGLFADPLMER